MPDSAPPRRLRFGLRTLLLATAAVACLLGLPATYQYFFQVRITGLSDAEAERLFVYGASDVRPGGHNNDEWRIDEKHSAIYRSRWRTTNATAKQATLSDGSLGFRREEIVVGAERPEDVEQFLQQVAAADQPSATHWVARGVVVDAAGEPVAGARVDLHGGFFSINACRAREDGTFFMAIDLSGYSPPYRTRFRVRAADEAWRYSSRRITIESGEHRQVRLRLPVSVGAD